MLVCKKCGFEIFTNDTQTSAECPMCHAVYQLAAGTTAPAYKNEFKEALFALKFRAAFDEIKKLVELSPSEINDKSYAFMESVMKNSPDEATFTEFMQTCLLSDERVKFFKPFHEFMTKGKVSKDWKTLVVSLGGKHKDWLGLEPPSYGALDEPVETESEQVQPEPEPIQEEVQQPVFETAPSDDIDEAAVTQQFFDAMSASDFESAYDAADILHTADPSRENRIRLTFTGYIVNNEKPDVNIVEDFFKAVYSGSDRLIALAKFRRYIEEHSATVAHVGSWKMFIRKVISNNSGWFEWSAYSAEEREKIHEFYESCPVGNATVGFDPLGDTPKDIVNQKGTLRDALNGVEAAISKAAEAVVTYEKAVVSAYQFIKKNTDELVEIANNGGTVESYRRADVGDACNEYIESAEAARAEVDRLVNTGVVLSKESASRYAKSNEALNRTKNLLVMNLKVVDDAFKNNIPHNVDESAVDIYDALDNVDNRSVAEQIIDDAVSQPDEETAATDQDAFAAPSFADEGIAPVVEEAVPASEEFTFDDIDEDDEEEEEQDDGYEAEVTALVDEFEPAVKAYSKEVDVVFKSYIKYATVTKTEEMPANIVANFYSKRKKKPVYDEIAPPWTINRVGDYFKTIRYDITSKYAVKLDDFANSRGLPESVSERYATALNALTTADEAFAAYMKELNDLFPKNTFDFDDIDEDEDDEDEEIDVLEGLSDFSASEPEVDSITKSESKPIAEPESIAEPETVAEEEPSGTDDSQFDLDNILADYGSKKETDVEPENSEIDAILSEYPEKHVIVDTLEGDLSDDSLESEITSDNEEVAESEEEAKIEQETNPFDYEMDDEEHVSDLFDEEETESSTETDSSEDLGYDTQTNPFESDDSDSDLFGEDTEPEQKSIFDDSDNDLFDDEDSDLDTAVPQADFDDNENLFDVDETEGTITEEPADISADNDLFGDDTAESVSESVDEPTDLFGDDEDIDNGNDLASDEDDNDLFGDEEEEPVEEEEEPVEEEPVSPAKVPPQPLQFKPAFNPLDPNTLTGVHKPYLKDGKLLGYLYPDGRLLTLDKKVLLPNGYKPPMVPVTPPPVKEPDYDVYNPEVEDEEDDEDVTMFASTPKTVTPEQVKIQNTAKTQEISQLAAVNALPIDDDVFEITDENADDDNDFDERKPKSVLYDPANPQPMQKFVPNSAATQNRKLASEALVALPELSAEDIKALKTEKNKQGEVIKSIYTIGPRAFESIIGRFEGIVPTKDLKQIYEYAGIQVSLNLNTVSFMDVNGEEPVETIYTIKKSSAPIIAAVAGGVVVLGLVVVVGFNMINNNVGNQQSPVDTQPNAQVTLATSGAPVDAPGLDTSGLQTWVPNAAGIQIPDVHAFSQMDEATIKAYLEVAFNKEVKSVTKVGEVANGVVVDIEADWLADGKNTTLFDAIELGMPGISNDYLTSTLLNRGDPIEYNGRLMTPLQVQVNWMPQKWAEFVQTKLNPEVTAEQLGVMTQGFDGFFDRVANSNSDQYATENSPITVFPGSFVQLATQGATGFTLVTAIDGEAEWYKFLQAGVDFTLFNVTDGTIYINSQLIAPTS